jgi:single-strand DNA-binding protein
MTRDEAAPTPDDNQVRLTGTVADRPQLRVLPSGDEVVTVRLVVRRPPSTRRNAPTVDTVDCAAWRAGARRTVSGWAAGERVAVEGALRRRFWRSPSGPASRYEVEVERGRRLGRA